MIKRAQDREDVEERMDELTNAEAAEESLSKEELLRLLVIEETSIGMMVLDRAGKIVFWNQGAQNAFGYPENEALGMEVHRLFTAEDRERKIPEQELEIASRKGSTTNERWQLKKDGTRFWAVGITRKLGSSDPRFAYTKAFQENTLRKLTDDEMKADHSTLLQFAYIASHDLNEPLRMVTSFLHLLKEKNEGRLDEDSKDYLKFACDGAWRMRRLLSNVLEYSKIGVTRATLREADCNVIVDSAIAFLEPSRKGSDALIQRANLPAITAVPSQIEQIFQNLISNSLKFRSTNRAKIFIDAQDRGHDWLFSVQDNGIGIAQENFENIFKIFPHVLSKEDYPGTGLGLSICRRIVERHGGTIWVESKLGVGSTFYFTIKKGLGSRPVTKDPKNGGGLAA